MSQFELFVIESPCVGICTMNKKGYCIGCLRNRHERQNWHTLSDNDKHKILILLSKRQRRLQDLRQQRQQPELDFDDVWQQLTFSD